MKALYLVDYSNWVYKFNSVYKVKRNLNGIEVNISPLYGFMRSLKSNPFTDINICLDGYPETSIGYLPSYKGQRIKEPEEGVSLSKKELIKFLTKYGELIGKNIKVVASAGQEADQVIASQVFQICGNISGSRLKIANIARRSPMDDIFLQRVLSSDYRYKDIDLSSYDSVVVGTTDSDMYQLLSLDGVMIDTTTSGKSFNLGEHTPKAVMGLKPSTISVYKSFVGDVSDNVPPVKFSKFKKNDLIDLINRKLNDKEKFNQFLRALHFSLKLEDEELNLLADDIKENEQVKVLTTNRKIVELDYVSTPYQIEFPEYNIEDTLRKFKINLK